MHYNEAVHNRVFFRLLEFSYYQFRENVNVILTVSKQIKNYEYAWVGNH